MNLESVISLPNYHPLPGRCVIRLDSPPTISGLLHIPETAQRGANLADRDKAWTGVVLHMTRKGVYGKGFQEEDFEVGDRVVIMLGTGDLGKTVIQTTNTRVYAVVLPGLRGAGGVGGGSGVSVDPGSLLASQNAL